MSVIDKKRVFEAKRKLADFLKDYPELQNLQEEIDTALKKAGKDPNNRMIVIHQMLMSSAQEMHKNLSGLSTILKNFTGYDPSVTTQEEKPETPK